MMYIYDNIAHVKQGDVVEYQQSVPNGTNNHYRIPTSNLVIVTKAIYNAIHFTNNNGEDDCIDKVCWKLVKTKPGSEAKVGDTAIRVGGGTPRLPKGKVFTVTHIFEHTRHRDIGYKTGFSVSYSEVRVLCTKESHYVNLCSEIVIRDIKPCPLPQLSYNESNHDDVADAISYIKPQENTMEPIIKLEINGKSIDVCKHKAVSYLKPKTDLKAKLPFAMVIYNADGSYDTIKYNKTKKGVLKRKQEYLQRPENLGKTVTLHKVFGEFTTNIPVVEVK